MAIACWSVLAYRCCARFIEHRYADAQYSEPVSDHILWRDRFTSIRDMYVYATPAELHPRTFACER